MWRCALVMVAACWTGEPPPPAQPAPQPAPRWHKPVAKLTAPLPSNEEPRIDPVLSGQLRTSGRSLLPTFVRGPVVVLDLDTNAITKLCGAAASQAAADWGGRFADPARSAPSCFVRSSPTVGCHQNGANDMLHLELDNASQPRIKYAIVGHWNAATQLPALLRQLRLTTDTATCP